MDIKGKILNHKFSILDIRNSEKYDTIEGLFEKSTANSVYYTLLFLSSVIVSSGLLLDNAAIVIGGILVAPLLTPILVIALGVSVGESKAIRSSLSLVLKSIFLVIVISFILSIIFGSDDNVFIFNDSLRLAVLYFIVAFASGVAATFAWTRKEVAEIMPGTAVSVSLMPPLAIVGIYLSKMDMVYLRLSLFVFIFNLVGIILGSMVVFSLLKFSKAEKVVEQEAKEQIEERVNK